jgi:hypothetical protein
MTLRVRKFQEGKEISADDTILDHVEWKLFWNQNQRYKTICLTCLSHEKEQYQKSIHHGGIECSNVMKQRHWGPVLLEDMSKSIVKTWYATAKGRISSDESATRMEISDDDEDDMVVSAAAVSEIYIDPKALKIANSWITKARFNLMRST